MCFSASASFAAGASLSVVGIVTLTRTEARREIPFAMIPLLFGIQQIAAYLVHVLALVSIWCFFAAILSLLIFVHLRFRDLGGFPKARAHSPPMGDGLGRA